MSSTGDLSAAPAEFLTALAALRRAQCRPELNLAELPAPSKLAPYAVALEAVVTGSASGVPGEPDTELATGRFILLHDPAGRELWGGTFRMVTYIRAELEADIGKDELLGSVAWAWLVEALENHCTGYRNAGGTATRILSQSFGTMAGSQDSVDIELRASWTPDSADVQSHLEAWSEMVCSFAGLPPLPDGVLSLPQRRH